VVQEECGHVMLYVFCKWLWLMFVLSTRSNYKNDYNLPDQAYARTVILQILGPLCGAIKCAPSAFHVILKLVRILSCDAGWSTGAVRRNLPGFHDNGERLTAAWHIQSIPDLVLSSKFYLFILLRYLFQSMSQVLVSIRAQENQKCLIIIHDRAGISWYGQVKLKESKHWQRTSICCSRWQQRSVRQWEKTKSYSKHETFEVRDKTITWKRSLMHKCIQ